jgi:hypothetical protein
LEILLSKILQKFESYIIYIRWEPKDEIGNITYGQKESIAHCMTNYSHEVDWIAFIDMDEFIYSSVGLKKVFETCDEALVGKIILKQKKFDDRFNNLEKPVTNIVDCIEGIDTSLWGLKSVIRSRYFDYGHCNWGIHNIPTKNCLFLVAEITQLRFNHYNVNSSQLEWMKLFYHTRESINLNSKCYELHDLYFSIMK